MGGELYSYVFLGSNVEEDAHLLSNIICFRGILPQLLFSLFVGDVNATFLGDLGAQPQMCSPVSSP